MSDERYCVSCEQVVRPTRLPIAKILGTVGIVLVVVAGVFLFSGPGWIVLLAVAGAVAAFFGSARAEPWAQAVCPICSGSELLDEPPAPLAAE